ncbi:hypothetical protein PG997_001890 [Apiospora hydei]|uniref:Uncharacterized protein n=1 Tax=Apiospora hydei TaxID=1337664 RepID=A0ABR1X7W6_9PEZI
MDQESVATLSEEDFEMPPSAKKYGPDDVAFPQHLIDHSIHPPLYRYPDGTKDPEPSNMSEIRAALREPRPSFALTDDEVSDFHFKYFSAKSIDNALSDLLALVNADDRLAYLSSDSKLHFDNLDDLTDDRLEPAKPCYYQGSRPESLQLDIREDLDALIVPSAYKDLPILPNFFVETELRGCVARCQAIYAGALGARAMHSLRCYGSARPDVYDQKAYTIAATYHGGGLMLFASHIVGPEPGANHEDLCYATTFLDFLPLLGDPEVCRRSVATYRNARDWARRQRKDAIHLANQGFDSRGDVDSMSSEGAMVQAFEAVVDQFHRICDGRPAKRRRAYSPSSDAE